MTPQVERSAAWRAGKGRETDLWGRERAER